MKNIFTLVGLCICLHTAAQVQSDSLQSIIEVQISENGIQTPLSKLSKNITIINKEMISRLPARTLNEVLQYANGVDLRQRGPFGTQADVSIDGGSFEQTVVLLNGAKVIDAQTAHNMLNLPIMTSQIERIEIIRGPAARVYGINSLTGAINIITKKSDQSFVEVQLTSGSNFEKNVEGNGDVFFANGASVGVGLAGKTAQHNLNTSWDKGNGYRFNTGFRNLKFGYQGDYKINEANDVKSFIGFIDNDFGANAFYAAPGDKNSHERVQTLIGILQAEHKISDNWSLLPRLSYRYNFDDYRYLGKSQLNVARSKHYSHSYGAEVHMTYQSSIGSLSLGTEIRKEQINSSNIGERERYNTGIYAQLKSSPWEKVDLNFGSYLNYHSIYGWQLYPGLDLSYTVSDGFRLVGNIGSSQRIPSFTDLYLDQRPGNIGNTDVVPEDAFQSEIGLKLNKGSLQINSFYFYRTINNFIDWTRSQTTDPWEANNTGKLFTHGLSIQTGWNQKLTENSSLSLRLAYTYLASNLDSAHRNTPSKYQISSLKHQITNTIQVQLKNTSLLFATRFSERLNTANYWVNDFRLSQALNKVTLTLDAQNIFDTRYFEIGGIPLPSRWFNLGLHFKM